jgi:hypothetical protein
MSELVEKYINPITEAEIAKSTLDKISSYEGSLNIKKTKKSPRIRF